MPAMDFSNPASKNDSTSLLKVVQELLAKQMKSPEGTRSLSRAVDELTKKLLEKSIADVSKIAAPTSVKLIDVKQLKASQVKISTEIEKITGSIIKRLQSDNIVQKASMDRFEKLVSQTKTMVPSFLNSTKNYPTLPRMASAMPQPAPPIKAPEPKKDEFISLFDKQADPVMGKILTVEERSEKIQKKILDILEKLGKITAESQALMKVDASKSQPKSSGGGGGGSILGILEGALGGTGLLALAKKAAPSLFNKAKGKIVAEGATKGTAEGAVEGAAEGAEKAVIKSTVEGAEKGVVEGAEKAVVKSTVEGAEKAVANTGIKAVMNPATLKGVGKSLIKPSNLKSLAKGGLIGAGTSLALNAAIPESEDSSYWGQVYNEARSLGIDTASGAAGGGPLGAVIGSGINVAEKTGRFGMGLNQLVNPWSEHNTTIREGQEAGQRIEENMAKRRAAQEAKARSLGFVDVDDWMGAIKSGEVKPGQARKKVEPFNEIQGQKLDIQTGKPMPVDNMKPAKEITNSDQILSKILEELNILKPMYIALQGLDLKNDFKNLSNQIANNPTAPSKAEAPVNFNINQQPSTASAQRVQDMYPLTPSPGISDFRNGLMGSFGVSLT